MKALTTNKRRQHKNHSRPPLPSPLYNLSGAHSDGGEGRHHPQSSAEGRIALPPSRQPEKPSRRSRLVEKRKCFAGNKKFLSTVFIARGGSRNSRGQSRAFAAPSRQIFSHNWRDVSHCLKLMATLPSSSQCLLVCGRKLEVL